MAYLWFKTFHIIGVVVWFAGLFYLVRLFVYHAEANEQPEPAQAILKQQYQVMEKRLYNMITTPGMVLTVAMAIALLINSPDFLQDIWMQVKLGLVGLLLAYHFYCGWVLKQLAAGKDLLTGQQFRYLNEVPTILLLVIVLLAVFKNSFPTNAAVWAIAGSVVVMIAVIQMYAKHRRRNAAAVKPLEQSATSVNS